MNLSQDSWELVADIGFGVVIFGVALEIIDLVSKWKKEHRNESILVKDAWWLWWIEAASVIFVVVGLAVEFIGGLNASQLARQKIADLTQKAKASFDKAKSAEDDAGKSIVFAAQIGITNSWLVASNLQNEAKIEELKSNNIVLGEQMAPREIEEFAPSIALQKFAGVNAVIIASPAGDSLPLAWRIATILQMAHWNVSPVFLTGQQVEDGVNVSVCFTNQTSFPPIPEEMNGVSDAEEMLVSELNKGGVVSQAQDWEFLGRRSRIPFDGVFIVVGQKPTAADAEMIRMENELDDLNRDSLKDMQKMYSPNITQPEMTELQSDMQRIDAEEQNLRNKRSAALSAERSNLEASKQTNAINGVHIIMHDTQINPGQLP